MLANVVSGLGINEFLSRTDIGAGTASFFLTDALGSPVAVTDTNGAVQTEYTYEPFGRTTISGASNASSYQYTGRENDGTGLYYYRARYYHPELQRFVSEDPWRFRQAIWSAEKQAPPIENIARLEIRRFSGAFTEWIREDEAKTQVAEPNLYGYVLNQPLRYTDPSGEIPWIVRFLIGRFVSWLTGKPMGPQWPAEELDDDGDGVPNYMDPDSPYCKVNCQPPAQNSKSDNGSY